MVSHCAPTQISFEGYSEKERPAGNWILRVLIRSEARRPGSDCLCAGNLLQCLGASIRQIFVGRVVAGHLGPTGFLDEGTAVPL